MQLHNSTPADRQCPGQDLLQYDSSNRYPCLMLQVCVNVRRLGAEPRQDVRGIVVEADALSAFLQPQQGSSIGVTAHSRTCNFALQALLCTSSTCTLQCSTLLAG